MQLARLAAGSAGCALLVLWGPAVSGSARLTSAAQEVLDRARTKVVVLKIRRSTGFSSGTGFLARSNLVLTAAHVVDGTGEATAWVNGVAYPAGVLERHPEHDLALLRLRTPELRLKPVELARGSGDLSPAEELMILAGPSQGPQANGEPAYRHPIAAAFSRRLALTDPTGRNNVLLSMRATVRKGDSGSPVLRVRDGQVVGVLSSREVPDAGGHSGFAYAVPVEAVHAWMDAALKRESEAEFYLFRHR